MKYEAFISYRHGGIDEKVATQIHKELERYRIPAKIAKKTGKKKIGRIFRDADELKAASDLSAAIKEALDVTEWLFVICTKRFKDSPWCMEEVEYFVEIRGRERIIVILVEGEPWESFPKILTQVERDGEIVEIEPLAVDIRADTDRGVLKALKQERFRFFSSMLAVDYDDLRQRQRERRLKQVGTMVAAGFLSLSAVIAIIATKNLQLEDAYAALDQSNQSTLMGESYYLAEYSNEAYENGDKKTAAMLALKALPETLQEPDRPYVPGVMRSLTQALGIYDFSYGYQKDSLFDIEQETYDVKTQISTDKKLLLLEKYFYAAGNMLTREVSVYALEEQKKLCEYKLSTINRSNYSTVSRGALLLKDNKTLLYLGEDGLRAVDVYTKKIKFSGDKASEFKISQNEEHIVSLDYEGGRLYGYDGKGEQTLNCELGTDMNYTLGEISTSGTKVSMAANTESAYGIILIDLISGDSSFVSMVGHCTNVRFLDDDRLCFLLSDEGEGLKHIVRYEITDGKEGYLCNADWDLSVITLTEEQTCYYYHENKVYEVDCNDKKGKKIWEYTFASDVNSIKTGDGIVGITCEDGSASFFEEKTKHLINTQKGNGEQFYLLEVNGTYASLRDYWGKNVRVYKKNDRKNEETVDEENVKSLDIADLLDEIPNKWYTCSTDGSKVVMGFQNGIKKRMGIFDAENFTVLTSKQLTDLQYEGFDNLTIDVKNKDYISIQDYGYYQTAHYQGETMEQTFSFDENNYYYYNEDGSLLYLTEDGKIQEYESATGEKKAEYPLLSGYDKGVKVGDDLIFSSGKEICIQDQKKSEEKKVIKDAELYAFHAERGLLFYRNEAGTKWYVYSLAKKKVVCEGDAGTYSCTVFFGNGRYFLNDYSEVYDMDTWKQVLDLSEISNGVYGVQTTDDLSYFVVWYQENNAKKSGKASGSNVAYLYEKGGTGEIVGVIPNFVAMAKDGEVIVYDGNHDLYKMPLYSAAELKKKAEQYIGKEKFTDYQKEKYHLYRD